MTDRRLLISGTGRAGTSFLVRYMTEIGMDTVIARRGDAAKWNEEANAGFETHPHEIFNTDAPYVCKSVWLPQAIDQVLEQSNRIDGLIVPIRNLEHAARSRVETERRWIKSIPWMTSFKRPWDAFAKTPGGITYSLNETDQARILAVDFHRLVERCVAIDLPLVFIHFPRIVTDGEYLFAKLRTWLPVNLTAKQAADAFARTADATKVHNI